MAAGSAWLAVASLLAAFNIEKAVDGNGELIDPAVQFSPGFIR